MAASTVLSARRAWNSPSTSFTRGWVLMMESRLSRLSSSSSRGRGRDGRAAGLAGEDRDLAEVALGELPDLQAPAGGVAHEGAAEPGGHDEEAVPRLSLADDDRPRAEAQQRMPRITAAISWATSAEEGSAQRPAALRQRGGLRRDLAQPLRRRDDVAPVRDPDRRGLPEVEGDLGRGPWSTRARRRGAAWLPMSAASRSSMPERLGSSFCIFLRTATALVAKPSRRGRRPGGRGRPPPRPSSPPAPARARAGRAAARSGCSPSARP